MCLLSLNLPLVFSVGLFICFASLGLFCCAVLLCLQRAGAAPQLQRAGFSMRWLLLLQSAGSRAQDCSCGAWASLLRGLWDLPGSGIKPMSPTLAGEFFTTEPAGKPKNTSISFQQTPKVASVLCRGLCVYVLCSVAQSCPTLCEPMDYNTPGLPVHPQLPELAQTQVH